MENDDRVIVPAMHLSHPFFVTMDNERLELEGVVRLFVGFIDQPSGLRKGVKVEPTMLDVES